MARVGSGVSDALLGPGSGLLSSVRTATVVAGFEEDNLLGMEDSPSESQSEGVTPILTLQTPNAHARRLLDGGLG